MWSTNEKYFSNEKKKIKIFDRWSNNSRGSVLAFRDCYISICYFVWSWGNGLKDSVESEPEAVFSLKKQNWSANKGFEVYKP